MLDGVVEALNFINAPLVAGERGIEQAQSKIEPGWGYSHLIGFGRQPQAALDVAGAVAERPITVSSARRLPPQFVPRSTSSSSQQPPAGAGLHQ